jgi:hypothetical protein
VRQGLRLDPSLQAISDFLENQKDLIEQVRCDLTRGFEKSRDGSQRLDAATGAALDGSLACQELELSGIARADCRRMHTAPGVKVVSIQQRGGTKAPEREAYEKSREFTDG